MSSQPQLLTGARGVIQVSNPQTGALQTLAFATSISVNVRAGVRPTYVTGRMNAGAIDPLTYDVDVSIGRVIPLQGETAAGPVPAGTPWTPPVANGQSAMVEAPTAVGSGLEPTIVSMRSAPDLVIAVYDQNTGAYINSVTGCRFAGRGDGLTAGDVGTENLNFVGLWDSGYNAQENTGTAGYGLG
jgi:hypothetical protein